MNLGMMNHVDYKGLGAAEPPNHDQFQVSLYFFAVHD